MSFANIVPSIIWTSFSSLLPSPTICHQQMSFQISTSILPFLFSAPHLQCLSHHHLVEDAEEDRKCGASPSQSSGSHPSLTHTSPPPPNLIISCKFVRALKLSLSHSFQKSGCWFAFLMSNCYTLSHGQSYSFTPSPSPHTLAPHSHLLFLHLFASHPQRAFFSSS